MRNHATAAVAALAFVVGTADAQQPARRDSSHRDTVRTDSSTRGRTLEGVIVRAVRANGTAPIAQTAVDSRTIQQRSYGQDVPMMLLGTTPSLTAHSESGTNWGYSYLRLRGIDQSRINLSIDGIPLNDPEDQVFYFANFADLASSVQSVQVQRGVGTSGAGTASFAGSVNFETKPVLGQPAQVAAEVQAGSFNAKRLMVEGNTGPMAGGFAASLRLSALRTESYRRHAGVEGLSGLAQVAWLGRRDVVKLMLLGGRLRDTLSYLAVPLADLRTDRRINPLGADEGDRFSQTLAALSHTRQLGAGAQYATTAYRVAARGNYDVRFDPSTLANYGLDFHWYGVTSAVTIDRGGARVSAGLNANSYARDHFAYFSASRTAPEYLNTGQKRDGSVFTKVAYTSGAVTWFTDLQLRRALMRYVPDPTAQFNGAEPSKSWTFFNPKVGVTWSATPRSTFFASVGSTTREPTRTDLLSGNDNIDAAALADLGGLSGVKPERVTDTELGVRWRDRNLQLEVNLFRMDFRNEIARIGALSPLGAELRSNVGASVRQGVEFDLRARPLASLTLTTVGAVSHNRIRAFVDNAGTTPGVTRRNVPPLLTPAVTGTQRADWRATPWLEIGAEARYQGASYLRNDGDRALQLPAYWLFDAQVSVPFGNNALTVRGANLGDSKQFGSGYAVGAEPHYFILTPRSVFVTLRLGAK